ncbi:MAG TPA: (d)CMP kinase [Chthoniobacterales bacterium]|nr:(d)CMP kinase [Chthoniobacterales bacterium]
MQSQDRHRVVAIDGPAASGKSSVAREIARRLGFAYVNSGAMYRALTWHILEHGIDPSATECVIGSIESAEITCDLQNNESRLLIDGVDPVDHLRDDRVNNGVPLVSRIPGVRQILVEKMREYARACDLVMEGRDIGSVVFPDTPYKFYLDASPEVRAQRRAAQGEQDAVAARDYADSSRSTSPLVMAEDAYFIDTSNLAIAQVVDEILRELKLKKLTANSRL